MARRRIVTATSCIALMMVLFSTSAAQESITISVAFWGAQSEYDDIWVPIKGDFEEAHPNIELRLLYVPDGFDERITTMVLGGESPDLWMSNPDTAIQYWTRGMTTDLSPLMERDPDLDRGNFFPAALEAYNLNGVQVGFPTHIQVTGVWYNENLFDQSGIAFPESDWTWDDFRESARKMTRRPSGTSEATQWGTVLPMATQFWMPWIFSAGGSIVDDLKQPTTATLTSSATLGAFEFLRRLVVEDRVVEPSLGDPDMFYQGKVGMYPYYAIAQRMSSYAVFPYNVAVFPAGSAGSVNALLPGGIVMGKTERTEESWAFIKFLAGKGAFSYNTIPSYIPFARTDEWPFVPVPEDYNRDAWIQGAINSKPQIMAHPNAREIYGAVDLMEEAIVGNVAIRPQAESIAEQINGLLGEE